MAKQAYVGVSGVARTVKNMYVGVNGVARRVLIAYVGVNGVARQCYEGRTTLTIKAKDQTITYGQSITTGTGQVTVTGLSSGHTVSSITLTPSTSSATTSGTITPSAIKIVSGSTDVTNHYLLSYQTGKLTINKANPSYTAPTAKSLTYNGTTNSNGNAQTTLNAGSTSHGTIYYSADNSSWSTTIPTKTNAGTYTVYWKLTGDANHNSVNSTGISVTVARKGITRVTGKTTSFTYNGSAKTVEVNNYDSNTSTRGGTYSATNASTSYSATFTPQSNFQWSSGSNTTSAITITWSIAKATPTVTAPTAKSLTYNGSAQTLINAGSTTGGTLQYKLGSGSYSTSLPSATNAGTYTVYYKVVGGTNYNDVAEKSISVTIQEVRTLSITVTGYSFGNTDWTNIGFSCNINGAESSKDIYAKITGHTNGNQGGSGRASYQLTITGLKTGDVLTCDWDARNYTTVQILGTIVISNDITTVAGTTLKSAQTNGPGTINYTSQSNSDGLILNMRLGTSSSDTCYIWLNNILINGTKPTIVF